MSKPVTESTDDRHPLVAVVKRLFEEKYLLPEWFTAAVLAAKDISELQSIVDEHKKKYGRLLNASLTGDVVTLHFEAATIPVRAAVDANGQIGGLFFLHAVPHATDLVTLRDRFSALPGRCAILVIVDDQEVFSISADVPLAVGSAFKIFVHGEICRKVTAGEIRWNDVVILDENDFSLGGTLERWPVGAPITVHSLCSLMIGESDNTATDALLRMIGKSRLERASGNCPFLSTKEMFLLKYFGKDGVIKRYKKSSLSEKRRMLRALSSLKIPPIGTGALVLDDKIEWHYSVRELCGKLRDLRQDAIMRINPGPFSIYNWKDVAFKAGREPGVINYTVAFKDENGHEIACSATWNGEQAVSEEDFLFLIKTALVASPKFRKSPDVA